MNFVLKLVEFVLGLGGIIAWVTILGLAFSKIAPAKLRKKKVTFVDTISIAGIGLFCTLLTLFFFFIAPKLGLGEIYLTKVLGLFLAGTDTGWFFKWGGRLFTITLGSLCSFIYAFLFFTKVHMKPLLKGPLFGLILFIIGTLFVFPVIGLSTAVQTSNYWIPSLFGLAHHGMDEVLTFLAAMLLFGAVMAGIYNEWDDA